MPRTDRATPYSGDAEYIDDEITWLTTKAQRLAAEFDLREAERDPGCHGTRVGRRHKPVAADEARRRVSAHHEQEIALRSAVDARLHATRTVGTTLGLDQLCIECALDGAERLALLAALMPALGEKLTQAVLGGLDSYIVTSPTVELLLLLAEAKTVAERLKVRAMFESPEAPLVKHGLVTMEYHGREASPADLPGAMFTLTEGAFRAILGLDE